MRSGLCLCVLIGILASNVSIGQETKVQMHFLDVGEGQCTLIDLGDKEILVDGGLHGEVVREYLDFTKVIDPPIELVVITHADADAFGGLSAVFLDGALPFPFARIGTNSAPWSPIPVSEVWEPGDYLTVEEQRTSRQPQYGKTFIDFLSKINSQKNLTFKRPLAKFHAPALETGKVEWFALESIPGAQFAVLSSGTVTDPPGQHSLRQNNASIVFMMKAGNKTVYFGGGVNGADKNGRMTAVEAKLVHLAHENPGVLGSEILVGPRNGSATASSLEYIASINPKLVLFGTSKIYRHPRKEVLARYQQMGVKSVVTDLHDEGGRDHVILEWSDTSDFQMTFGVGYGSETEATKSSEWAGRNEKGEIITKSDIDTWLRRVASYEREPRGADPRNIYRKADLSRIDLRGKRLAGFDFTEVDFRQAHLEEADLTGAKLSKADFRGAFLAGANLTEGDLSQARLDKCDLQGVNFRNASLESAVAQGTLFNKADFELTNMASMNLHGANLTKAKLVDCSLKDAILGDADLSGVVFEPLDFNIKNARELRRSPYLKSFTYENSPHALIELRKDVWDAGFEAAGLELTYVIEKGRTERASIGEKWLRRALFEWPVGYGKNPVRPLLIVLGLAITLAIPYRIAMHRRTGGGIFRVPGENPMGIPGELKKAVRVREQGLNGWFLALYFSFLSAFRIGWRELNVGSWLLSFQPRDELFRANGWPRVLSGVQSLTSVYLFAITILSYFGRLFE